MSDARRRLVAVGLLLVSVGCGSAAEQAETVDGPDALVTDDDSLTRTHEAPNLLVDRDDPDTIYLSEVELQTGDCRFYVSRDRGGTWASVDVTVDSAVERAAQDDETVSPEAQGFVDCGLGPTGPQNIRTHLEQASDGTLYYVFHAHDPDFGGTRSILLGRSRDRGRSWETTVVHAGPDADDRAEVEVNFLPHLALDSEDPQRVYVMWRRSYPRVEDVDDRPTRPWMAVSEDGGTTFGEPFMMLDQNTGFDAPRPVVVDGELHTFYRVQPASEGDESPPTSLFAAVSADGGKSWQETQIASEADASEPIPLYDADRGAFYVVWHDNRNGDLDVFLSRSAEGVRWSDPVRLNDDPAENGIGQYYPQISLAPSGRIDVAWYDYRDDPNPPPQPDEEEPLGLFSNLGQIQSVYYTSSGDGGETWSDNLRLNDSPIDRTIGTWNRQFFVVAPLSIASWDDRVLVSWSDTRNGTANTSTQDIYTSAAALGAGGIADSRSLLSIVAGAAGLLIGAGLVLLIVVIVMRRTRRPEETGTPAKVHEPVS